MEVKSGRRRRGTCYACWVRTEVRPVELLEPHGRYGILTWRGHWVCGACAAWLLSGDIGMDIPS